MGTRANVKYHMTALKRNPTIMIPTPTAKTTRVSNNRTFGVSYMKNSMEEPKRVPRNDVPRDEIRVLFSHCHG